MRTSDEQVALVQERLPMVAKALRHRQGRDFVDRDARALVALAEIAQEFLAVLDGEAQREFTPQQSHALTRLRAAVQVAK